MKMKLITGQDIIKPQTVFSGVIGQTDVLRQLRFLTASHDHSTPFPTLLLTGSHGLGKTFLAEKVAKNLNRKYVEINCKMVETKEELFAVLFSQVAGDQPVTILFDEAHTISKEVETVLLSLLAPNHEHKNTLSYKLWDVEFDLRLINVIFATTDAFRMFKPLRNRTKTIYFKPYSEKELYRIVQLYAKGLVLECDSMELAQAARGRARDAYDLAQDLKRVSTSTGRNIIRKEDWENLKAIFGIAPLGLKEVEVDLLKVVGGKGPISCNNIAIHMMINPENVSEEIEIRPRELNLIKNTTKGRVLTEEGRKYLNS